MVLERSDHRDQTMNSTLSLTKTEITRFHINYLIPALGRGIKAEAFEKTQTKTPNDLSAIQFSSHFEVDNCLLIELLYSSQSSVILKYFISW